jgi:hypothetical protein
MLFEHTFKSFLYKQRERRAAWGREKFYYDLSQNLRIRGINYGATSVLLALEGERSGCWVAFMSSVARSNRLTNSHQHELWLRCSQGWRSLISQATCTWGEMLNVIDMEKRHGAWISGVLTTLPRWDDENVRKRRVVAQSCFLVLMAISPAIH